MVTVYPFHPNEEVSGRHFVLLLESSISAGGDGRVSQEFGDVEARCTWLWPFALLDGATASKSDPGGRDLSLRHVLEA